MDQGKEMRNDHMGTKKLLNQHNLAVAPLNIQYTNLKTTLIYHGVPETILIYHGVILKERLLRQPEQYP